MEIDGFVVFRRPRSARARARVRVYVCDYNGKVLRPERLSTFLQSHDIAYRVNGRGCRFCRVPALCAVRFTRVTM